MKALSLKQPWAWAVVHAGKNVENRTWSTPFRGRFFIHASRTCEPWYYEEAVRWMVTRGLVPFIPALEQLERGGIVGEATLASVLAPAPSGTPRAPWHMADQHGFVLEDVRPLPFRPLRGCLGLFEVVPHLEMTEAEQLSLAAKAR